jgi:hypothetical protein
MSNDGAKRWGLRGCQIRDDNGTGAHVATYQRTREEGLLIAAAPDLYYALHAVLACLPRSVDGTLADAVRAGRAAIAKAEEKGAKE